METGKSKKGWSDFKKGFAKWIKLVLEVVAFILLVSKIIPQTWIESGWMFLVLMTIALIGLSVTNFILITKSTKIADEINEGHKQQVVEWKEKEKVLEKKARYAEIFPMLNVAFQELHNAIRRDHSDKTKYHEYLVICCHNIEKAFSKITGKDCHVSIKMAQFPNGQIPTGKVKSIPNILLRTYCRSSSSSTTRKEIDNQKQLTHPVKENSDFESIYTKHADHYLCNDLTKLEVYMNSSLKHKHGNYIIYPKSMSEQDRGKAWPLAYKSVLVVPIRPTVQEDKKDGVILGCLCVDSKETDVFEDEIDKHILIGCADGIYNSFIKIFNLNK